MSAAVAVAVMSLSPAWIETAAALPVGGQVTAGAATVRQSNGRTTIDQASARAALNWTSFSIGAGESVVFRQPSASAVALNRVVGSEASTISGSLQANGHVFLVNPSGILFSRGASVDVGGLVASTLNIANQDFMSGRYVFSGGAGSGAVVNEGTIRAANGGYVALLGNQVTNTGTIVANAGSVALGAGDTMLLDFAGDGLLSLKVNTAAAAARIDHGGLIHADGGRVIMSAQAKNALTATALNVEGIVRARGIAERNGEIFLDGGRSGVTRVSGTLDASSAGAGSKGGGIRVLGEYVGLFGAASLNASGPAGGGSILIGGDFQGRNPAIRNASRTYVGRNASIRADAADAGDGGKVIVWADDWTKFYGTISARGGVNGGNGGFAEVSGKVNLGFDGFVDLRAPKGVAGRLLLDPQILTFIDAAGSLDVGLGADGAINFAEGGANESVSVASANATGAISDLVFEAGQIRFDNSLDIVMGLNRSISFTTNAGVALGGDNSIVNTGGNPFSIVTSGAGAMTFTTAAGGNVDLTNVTLQTGAGGAVTFNAGGSVVLGPVTTPSLNVSAAGPISDTGVLTVSGTTTLAAGAGNDITLDNANDFGGAVSVVSGNNVTLNDINAIDFGPSAISGNLTVTAAGAITDSAALAVTGATTLTAGAGNDVTLDNANDFVGAVAVVSGNNVTLNDINAIELGASTIGGNLAVTAAGAITDSGALAVTGTTTLTAGAGNDINLDNSNNFGGAVSVVSANNVVLVDVTAIDLGASTISGNLAVVASGLISDSGDLTVGGTTALSALGGNDITLDGANNNFTGAVSIVSGNNVTLNDISAIDLGASTIGGNLAVTAAGAITDSGALAVTGTTTLTAGTANSITLDNANDFGGAVAVVSADNVTLNDVNAIILGTSTVNGNLLVTAGGTLTQTGALRVVGTSGFGAGANAITLTDVANDFSGAVTATGSDVGLTDTNDLTVGNLTATGTATLAAGGSIVQGAGTIITAGTLAGSAGASAVFGESNALTNLGPFTTSGTFTLNDAAGGLTITGDVSAGAGAVTITAAGADSVLTNNANIASTTSVELNADRMALGGNIATTIGGAGKVPLVILRPTRAGQQIALGGADAPGTLGLSQAEFDTVHAQNLRVGRTDAGAITVPSDVNLTTADVLHLITNGSITGTAGHIAVPGLALEAASANLADPTNQVITLAAVVTPGGAPFTYNGTGLGVTVGSLDGITGITTNNGDVAVTTSGSLTLASPIFAGTANVALNAAAIVQNAGAGITATLLSGSSGAGALLDKNNAVANLGPFTANGNFTFNDVGGGLMLTGGVAAGAGAASIATSGGALVLQSNNVSGVGGVTLTGAGVTSTGGTISTTAAAGSGTASGAVLLTATGTSAIDLGGAIVTSGADNAAGTASAGGNVTVTTADGPIALAGVNARGGDGTAGNSSGGNAGTIAINVGGGKALTLNGNLVSSGGNASGTGAAGAGRSIAIAVPVLLGADAIVSAGRGIGAGIATAGDVTFAGIVESPGSARAFTVNTGGATVFGATVGGNGNPLSTLTTDAGGSTAINGGAVVTAAGQTYGDGVTLGTHTVLTSNGGGNLILGGGVDGAFNLALNTGGRSLFGGVVGGTSALASIVTDAPGDTVVSAGGVTTTGSQMFNDPVILGANPALTSTAGNITFAQAIDADASANNRMLTVAAPAGAVTFAGNIGAAQALAGLDVTAGPGNIVFAGGAAQSVNVSAQGGNTARFSGPMVLATNLSVNTDGAADNNVTFAGPVDADAFANARTLTVTSGTGTTTFAAALGSSQPLGAISVSGDTLVINGDVRVTGGGAVDFGNVSNLAFSAGVTIETDMAGGATAAGDILFNAAGRANSPTTNADLTVDASADNGAAHGDVRLGTFGDAVTLGALTLTGNTVTFAGPVSARQVHVTANVVATPGGEISATQAFGNNTSEANAALLFRGLDDAGQFGTLEAPIRVGAAGLFVVIPNTPNSLPFVFLAGDPNKRPVYEFADNPAHRSVFYNGVATDSPADRAAQGAIVQQLRALLDELSMAGFAKENIRRQLLQGIVLETGLARPGVDEFSGEGVTAPSSCQPAAKGAAGGALAC